MTMGINSNSGKNAHHGLPCVKLNRLKSLVGPEGVLYEMEVTYQVSASKAKINCTEVVQTLMTPSPSILMPPLSSHLWLQSEVE